VVQDVGKDVPEGDGHPAISTPARMRGGNGSAHQRKAGGSKSSDIAVCTIEMACQVSLGVCPRLTGINNALANALY
jgi:hypothetical protein